MRKTWLVTTALLTGATLAVVAINRNQRPKTTRKTMKFSDGVAAMGALVKQELLSTFGDDEATIAKIESAFSDASLKLPGHLVAIFGNDLANAFMERADEQL